MQNASILNSGVPDFSENYFEIKPFNAKKFLLLHAFIRQRPKQINLLFLMFFFSNTSDNQVWTNDSDCS